MPLPQELLRCPSCTSHMVLTELSTWQCPTCGGEWLPREEDELVQPTITSEDALWAWKRQQDEVNRARKKGGGSRRSGRRFKNKQKRQTLDNFGNLC